MLTESLESWEESVISGQVDITHRHSYQSAGQVCSWRYRSALSPSVEQDVATMSLNSTPWNVRLDSFPFTSPTYKWSNYSDLLDLTTFTIIHHSSLAINSPTAHTGPSLSLPASLSFISSLRHHASLPQILLCNYWDLCAVVLFGPLWFGCGWVERLRCSATAVVIFTAWLRLAALAPGRAGDPNWKGQRCLCCFESVCPHMFCGRWFSVACVWEKLF